MAWLMPLWLAAPDGQEIATDWMTLLDDDNRLNFGTRANNSCGAGKGARNAADKTWRALHGRNYKGGGRNADFEGP